MSVVTNLLAALPSFLNVLEGEGADAGRQWTCEADCKSKITCRWVNLIAGVEIGYLSLGCLYFSKKHGNKRNYEQIVDVGHKCHCDNAALKSFELIIAVDCQANLFTELVLPFE